MTAINYSKTAEKSYVDDKFFSNDKVLYINGHAYKVIKVGLQLWMSENLDEEVGLLGNNEWYYDNDESTYGRDGKKYGRLYNWTNLNTNLENKLVDFKASAWHLPTIEEWRTFLTAVGNKDVAAFRLKSSKDWNDENGIDYYSFNALPSGSYAISFTDVGDKAVFVTSSESDDNYYAVSFNSNNSFEEVLLNKSNGNSVRLVLNLNSDGSLPEDNALIDVYAKKGEAIENIYHDDTISGEGTEDSPLNVNEMVGASEEETSVKIGDRTYPVVKIGNQLWITENLDYKFSNVIIAPSGSPTTPSAWYYDNDEATYGVNGNKYGLLYNWHAVKHLEDNKETLLPDGWHVPSSAEFDVLADAVGGASVAGTELKSNSGWNSGSGTDDFGFSFFPAGYRLSGSFTAVGSIAYLWTATENSSAFASCRYFNMDASMVSTDSHKAISAFSVRLVKDATSSGRDGKKGLVPQPKSSDVDKVLSGAGTFVSQPSISYNDRKISQVQPDGTYKEIIETYNKDEIDEKFENINTFGVTIDNRTYRCEKIGNQLWMAENLDYKFEGCIIGATGTPTTSNAWYYNNDEATYGIDGTRKCGLLYNWYAIKYLEDNKSTLLPNGWRVPTRDDYSTLISESGVSRAGHYLKAEDNYLGNWPTNWNGIDEHNIAVLPSGYRNDSGNFVNVSESAYLWTSNEVDTNNAYAMMFARLSENLMSASYSKVCGIPVRLVLTLNDDGSIPSGYQVNKALATKEYVDGLVGNVEALLAAL